MGKPAARLMDMTAHAGMITGPGCPTVLIGKMPAAQMGNMHMCPMVTPGVPPIPHVGGPLVGPVPPTVLIGKMPAACMGDMAICVGPPSSVLPPGCPTVLLGQSGGGGGGGGGGSTTAAGKASTLSAKAPKIVEGTETFPIEIQQDLAKAVDYMKPEELKLKIQLIGEALAKAKGGVHDKDKKEDVPFTLKDIIEILKAVESEEGYEAARFFASYLDYSKMTEMAKTKDEEPDNDPNQMPSRFMLLYGMDDGSLAEEDDHPDIFEGGEEHKINIANLRKGLKLLGYEVAESGAYDDDVYAAHMQYLSHVKMGAQREEAHIVQSGEDLGSISQEYGIPSWKYLYELNKEAIGENPDLLEEGVELELPQWDTTSGDEKFEEKDQKAFSYCHGLRYYYPWVPISLTVANNDGTVYRERDDNGNERNEFENKKKYEIRDKATGTVLVYGDINASEELNVLVPDVNTGVLFLDGEEYDIWNGEKE